MVVQLDPEKREAIPWHLILPESTMRLLKAWPEKSWPWVIAAAMQKVHEPSRSKPRYMKTDGMALMGKLIGKITKTVLDTKSLESPEYVRLNVAREVITELLLEVLEEQDGS